MAVLSRLKKALGERHKVLPVKGLQRMVLDPVVERLPQSFHDDVDVIVLFIFLFDRLEVPHEIGMVQLPHDQDLIHDVLVLFDVSLLNAQHLHGDVLVRSELGLSFLAAENGAERGLSQNPVCADDRVVVEPLGLWVVHLSELLIERLSTEF